RVLREAELFPCGAPARTGVSAFGFGGINVHVALEAADAAARKSFIPAEIEQLSSAQDCELFVFAARNAKELSGQLAETLRVAAEISFSEITDLSILLAKKTGPNAAGSAVRAACVASSPSELVTALEKLLTFCEAGVDKQIDVQAGVFFSKSVTHPRIGFLFPGQASPVYTTGGMWARRFPELRTLYARARLPQQQSINTRTAQPCIATASLAGLQVLQSFNIQGAVALGHSLGEITALHWGGACSEDDLLGIVHARGETMADAGDPSGAMASIRASYADVMKRLNGDGLVVAARNAPLQTVVSGEAGAVKRFTEKLRGHGINATLLPVSHAFHSPLVARVATAFAEHLAAQEFAGLSRRVISTVTAQPLAPDADLQMLLTGQITKPVLFADALKIAAEEADFFVEVGPGAILTGIAAECMDKPVIALDAGGESLRGILSAVGAAFAFGADVRTAPLFEKRFGRPIDITKTHSFLANPCETAPQSARARHHAEVAAAPRHDAVATNSALEALLGLVAQRTQLPREAIQPEQRFLTDLHLSSITISQIILEAASQLSLPAPVAPAEFTNATLAEAAKALEGLRTQARNISSAKFPAGVDSWIRTLEIELVEKPLHHAPKPVPEQNNWNVTGIDESPFLNYLREAFRSIAGEGMVCCVPHELNEQSALFLLQSAQVAVRQKASRIVFVQSESGAGALARTLYLENRDIRVAVINVPAEHPEAAKWVAAEASTNLGFVEVHYDAAGTRREPRLKLLWPDTEPGPNALGSGDVLLVTGGGKGIAAESAFHLARVSGCCLALVGRSDPSSDDELRRNLFRLAEAGAHFSYFAADVTDQRSVENTIQKIQAELGPITAILHGAGINSPKRLEEITKTDLDQILGPKLSGLRNLLECIDPSRLRLLVTFGSIIARTGLHGEAHYGLANEWLNLFVERWQKTQPHCRCLNLEWSVWAGTGMGQRLGVLDSLVHQGITPLPIDLAIEHLQTMLGWKQSPSSAIITGRFGNLPTLKFAQPELPLMRFLEHPRLYHSGIELIADAELNTDTDPYVTEHAFQGEQLLPAVMGMEAMAQVAMALEQSQLLPGFRNLRFEHPIIVPGNKPVTIRIAALRRQPGMISTVVRCSSTGFKVDHFTGECIFAEKPSALNQPSVDHEAGHSAVFAAQRALVLDSAHDLYGHILFHHGRFSRIAGYELLHSDQSTARLKPPMDSPWFARHLPATLVMGDAASRDAALHSIQACIPHKTILPIGVDRVIPGAEWTIAPARVEAIERMSDGENFVYDLYIKDKSGRLCERWSGLHLRAVAAIENKKPWTLALLTPYLERIAGQTLQSRNIRIGFTSADEAAKKTATGNLVRELFGKGAILAHRPDGKPELAGLHGVVPTISISHAGDLTLLFSAAQNAGCDLEKVVSRNVSCWEKLLGAEDFALAKLLTKQSGAGLDAAATQIWSLKESLRKAGGCFGQPTVLNSCTRDGWASFTAGGFTAATFHANIARPNAAFALGFVLQRVQ
ncbi:MAG TPA: SDR family NAD(P)-dependent oxidoreductase, partial [Candidatus Angelobacter sp.]|nr:SDR family NAD(P)-dependent oxidoreductase [Candidatus Angelobacter sp.]